MVRFENLGIETIDVEQGIRQIIDKEPLDELVASIRQHGILQPLVVEPGEEGRYNLQIGKRRMAAARVAGLETVPAMILDRKLGAEESLAIRLVENIHREDLDPIDEAEAYASLKEMGTKVSAIARLVGKERTYVSHSLRLLKLHPKVREAVRQHTIPREHALALLRVEPYQQIALAEEIKDKGLTMVETRDRVRGLLGKELKWRLVPIRIEPAIYDRLVTIAPEGDVSKLLKQAAERARAPREIREMQFPVFARATSPGGSISTRYAVAVDVPIVCGGIRVHPGDIVVGDDDGICVIPQEIEEEALKWVKAYGEKDQAVAPALREGKTVAEAYSIKKDWVKKAGLEKG